MTGASIPFWWSSWRPHDQGAWVVLTVNQSSDTDLQIVDGPAGGHHVKIVMLTSKGRPAVFLLPYANDVYIMPDGQWFRMGGACLSFVVLDDHAIGCQQSDKRWEWGVDGRSYHPEVPDLIRAEFQVQGGQVRVKIPAEYQ